MDRFATIAARLVFLKRFGAGDSALFAGDLVLFKDLDRFFGETDLVRLRETDLLGEAFRFRDTDLFGEAFRFDEADLFTGDLVLFRDTDLFGEAFRFGEADFFRETVRLRETDLFDEAPFRFSE